MSDSDGDYGPSLPPSMKKSRDLTRSKSEDPPEASDSSSDENDCMPALPPSMLAPKKPNRSPDGPLSKRSRKSEEGAPVIGPTLPPHLSGARVVPDEDSHAHARKKSPAQAVRGPATPASLVKCDSRGSAPEDAAASSSDDDSYGPALPPGFVRRPVAAPPPRVKGPALPPGGLPPPEEDSEEEESVIGPLPPKAEVDLEQYAAADVERRANSMKQKLDDASRPVVHTREEWMLTLPPERAGEFGMGPRQFRRTTPAERGDTSVWTEVGGAEPRPAAKPAAKQEPEVDLAVRRRDEEMAEVAEKLKKGRKDSLLDIHQKKTKRTKEEGSEPGRRQEFDRDRDLATNRFDDAQRRAVIKRSRGASDMFSSGAQKFL